MAQKVVIFTMMGFTFALIVLATVSLATADWVHVDAIYQSSLGLWEFCNAGKCEPYPFKVADYVNATRAFHIIGTVFLCVAVACLAYYLSRLDDSIKPVALAYSFAGTCYLVSMAVFTAFYNPDVVFYYGYSYILGWVVVGGALIVGGCIKPLDL